MSQAAQALHAFLMRERDTLAQQNHFAIRETP